jgi:transcriptional regulator with XRE-family HTH domain
MEARKISNSYLIDETGISSTFTYQILNGERLPGRETLLKICFALKLSIDETQRTLTIAQKGVLYPKVRRDAAIIACIASKRTLQEADEYLLTAGEESLL